ncbi:hypothetical protein LVY72_13605 [Arthrobacter sp. I2-34]|uniref:Uncharacterized protein n=1 Tax=Arthrobacter hankyongi TaxID=2904801 RepID=A0ABS9L8M2_9MICC|nr:hypothetical protein [Arthrobacter hankyongi]MCG2622933.1 hypothetical protein [Arthrobacter hankyongi]
MVQDLEDFTENPDKCLVDLYADEEAAKKAWLRTGERYRFTYNDGVVTLSWQGIPLVGVPMWDDICGLWHYLVEVVDGYLSTGRGEMSFPDSPAPIILERIRGGALITIGDTKARVEPITFCRELLAEAERFWRWTDRWGIPVDSGYALPEIDRVRSRIPWR